MPFERALQADSQQQLDQLMARYPGQLAAVKTKVLPGRSNFSFLRVVSEEQDDVALWGTEEKSSVKRLLIGSNAGKAAVGSPSLSSCQSDDSRLVRRCHCF